MAGTTLQEALAQALKCPLLGPEEADDRRKAWAVPLKKKGAWWRPVWRKDAAQEGGESELYTLRTRHGKRYIVRRPGRRKVERCGPATRISQSTHSCPLLTYASGNLAVWMDLLAALTYSAKLPGSLFEVQNNLATS